MLYEVYGKDDCKFCNQALAILTAANLEFKYFKLGREFTRDELFEMFPSAKTFPQIRVKVQKMSGSHYDYVGGFTELQALLVANQN